MKRAFLITCVALLGVLSVGCGSSERERGKNSQLDRPKAASSTTAQQQ